MEKYNALMADLKESYREHYYMYWGYKRRYESGKEPHVEELMKRARAAMTAIELVLENYIDEAEIAYLKAQAREWVEGPND